MKAQIEIPAFPIEISGSVSRGCQKTWDDPGEPPSAEVESVWIGMFKLTEEQELLLWNINPCWEREAEAALLEVAAELEPEPRREIRRTESGRTIAVSDTPQVYSMTMPTAIKQHACCECHGQIQPGETYYRHKGVWDGKGDTFKECVDCFKLRTEIEARYDLRDEEVIAMGHLGDALRDYDDIDEMKAFYEIIKKRGGQCSAQIALRLTEYEENE